MEQVLLSFLFLGIFSVTLINKVFFFQDTVVHVIVKILVHFCRNDRIAPFSFSELFQTFHRFAFFFFGSS